MTDFHSHILPKTDDGSHSTEESIEMIRSLGRQGITRVVATPHFYANDESVSEFLSRRDAAYEKLKEHIPENAPSIVTGAEVRYYEGISRLENLNSLCVQGSGLLLMEMPGKTWTEYTIKELTDISLSGRLTLVLAHIERYADFQRPGTMHRLLDNGVLMQVNADFFSGFFSKRKALRMLRNGEIHFIGSDCHDMAVRKPEIKPAYETIRKKLGDGFLEDFISFGNNFFE